jgi:aspartate aminotransferase
MPSLSTFARSLNTETAFDVLAVARKLKAAGKDVIELQIGDSPFPSSTSAVVAGKAAIDAGRTTYAPSLGLPEFRTAAAKLVREEFNIPAQAENVVVAPGAKPFEQFFCELFLDPGDAVLVFEPAFPTYAPNIARRGAAMHTAALKQSNGFRPEPEVIERWIAETPKARAVFLNSPHNPTGGVMTPADLKAIAAIVRKSDVAVFSDEPYCHMAWEGRHSSLLAEPDMLDRCVAAYTFSKSYSMSGWRLGFAVTAPHFADAIGKMINTSLSCAPPFVQLGGTAALEKDAAERDATMLKFRTKVERLVGALQGVPDVSVLMPAGTFYVFPNVAPICERLGITSHGLAMYLLEGADDAKGVACLGGECFGPAGRGFLRFSCAEPDDRLLQAVQFFADAVKRTDRVQAYLASHPKYALK